MNKTPGATTPPDLGRRDDHSEPMRVLAITTGYPGDHNPTEAIFIRTQCEALNSAGVAVEVLSLRPWVPPGFARWQARWRCYQRTPRYYELNSIPVHRPRYFAPPRSDLWASPHRAYVRQARKIFTRPPDVIHAHFAYPCGLAAIRLAQKWGAPAVITLHGTDTNDFPYRTRRSANRFREAIGAADEVVAVSQALAKRAADLSGRMAKVIPIGLDLKRFGNLPDRTEARRRLGLPPDAAIILYVGRLLETKGVRELLTALARMQERRVLGLFIGAGPLEDEIAAASRCRCVGLQPNERIPLYMRAADLLVLPSHAEGMPTVLVEAGAVGLPVVSTAVGGIPELLDDGRGHLVPPHSVEDLRKSVEQVLAHPHSAAESSARLRAFVLARYDARRCVAELLEVYQSLRARNSAAAP